MSGELEIFAQEVEFDLKEEGQWYPATLSDVVQEEGKFGPQLKWTFVCDVDLGQGEDGADWTTWYWTPAKYYSGNDKSKLRTFMRWLTGDLFDGQRVPVAEQIGKRFDLMFEIVDAGDKKQERIMRVRPGSDSPF